MGGRIEASLLSKGSTNLKAVVSMQAGDVGRRVGGGERWGSSPTLLFWWLIVFGKGRTAHSVSNGVMRNGRAVGFFCEGSGANKRSHRGSYLQQRHFNSNVK